MQAQAGLRAQRPRRIEHIVRLARPPRAHAHCPLRRGSHREQGSPAGDTLDRIWLGKVRDGSGRLHDLGDVLRGPRLLLEVLLLLQLRRGPV
mgnify:CR=1 FL=1